MRDQFASEGFGEDALGQAFDARPSDTDQGFQLIGEGEELPDAADQFHPNLKSAAGHTGVDDGFVIKASASTGKADWIKHYPQSNSDAQVVGVDIDSAGNVYGSGYSCETAGADDLRVAV